MAVMFRMKASFSKNFWGNWRVLHSERPIFFQFRGQAGSFASSFSLDVKPMGRLDFEEEKKIDTKPKIKKEILFPSRWRPSIENFMITKALEPDLLEEFPHVEAWKNIRNFFSLKNSGSLQEKNWRSLDWWTIDLIRESKFFGGPNTLISEIKTLCHIPGL